MRALNVIVLGIIVACSAVAIGQSGAPQAAAPGQEGQGRGRGRGGEGAVTILQAAPTDKTVSIPLETLKGTTRTWMPRSARRFACSKAGATT